MGKYNYEKEFRDIMALFFDERKNGSIERIRSRKSENVYLHRFNKFINEHLSLPKNEDKKITEITADDVNRFISNIEKDKNNYYRTLSSFFDFTYRSSITSDIKKDINNPNVVIKKTESITSEDCIKIRGFINDKQNKLNDRLILALAYYSGLKVSMIISLTIRDFYNNYSELWISEKQIPINKALQDVLLENEKKLRIAQKEITGGSVNPSTPIIKIKNQPALSQKLSDLSLKATNNKYSGRPFELSFIQRALDVNCNPYFVAELTLKSVASIAKHIDNKKTIAEKKRIIDNI